MTVTPRVAVVGMGGWGQHIVRNFSTLGVLNAVCDTSDTAMRACRALYPSVRFTSDLQTVLGDPEVTAVALATPAATHFAFARAALEAGKDVFVEKPLALEPDQGATLAAFADRRERILMVGHILRYHPAVLKLQELIASGALGKLYYVYSTRLNIGKIRTEENILWSFAPHDLSVILALLNESPVRVASHGDSYLNSTVYDVTLTQLEFASGVQGHMFVSWLHPIKEQRLAVVGSQQMAVFDDMAEHKLVLYPHKVEWRNRVPTAVKADGQPIPVDSAEPLQQECRHFVHSVQTRTRPVTDGHEGLRVLRILDACQRSLFARRPVSLAPGPAVPRRDPEYFVHPSACVDEGAQVGAGTKIWHFSHVMKTARIGTRCVIGQNVNIDGATIGDNVKIQNNVSVYAGIVVEDDVFLGPSCVLTNVANPRSQIDRHALYETTVLRRGCTVGANATVVCGVTIGRYAFVGAGAVVTKDVPDYALMLGNPARHVGWMSRHGHRLRDPDALGVMRCPESGYRYRQDDEGTLYCLDLPEDEPLPGGLSIGTASYRPAATAPSEIPASAPTTLVAVLPEEADQR
jgi:UDP-2-acetamido-3-amino-2,3-dideoxy-glucuronate N-acetyltransferase